MRSPHIGESMRTRVFKDAATSAVWRHGISWKENGSERWNYPDIPYYVNRQLLAMLDVVTPDYKKLQNAGQIVNNPMWKISYSYAAKPSVLSGSGQCGGYFIQWKIGWLPAAGFVYDESKSLTENFQPVCDLYSSESSVAQVKAWANVDVSEMQVWASLGEFPETVRMIVDLLKLFTKLTIAAMRGDAKTLVKYLKKVPNINTLADTWLLWRYGVRPLMGDIQNLLAVLDANPLKGKRQTFRAKHKVEVDPVATSFNVGATEKVLFNFRRVVSSQRHYRAGVMVQIDSAIDSASALLGLDNPLEAVWELIPFSFIIDWFLNVGDIVNAMIANPSLEAKASFVTETITRSEVITCPSFSWTTGECFSTYESILLDPGTVSTWYTVKRRVPLAERFALPTLRLKLDVAKLTDLYLIARKF